MRGDGDEGYGVGTESLRSHRKRVGLVVGKNLSRAECLSSIFYYLILSFLLAMRRGKCSRLAAVSDRVRIALGRNVRSKVQGVVQRPIVNGKLLSLTVTPLGQEKRSGYSYP
jgi:hypothetical protein